MKHQNGTYHRGETVVQFPVTPDEELYQFHLCEWVSVPDEKRAVQQIQSRKIEHGIAFYSLSWSGDWLSEDELIRFDTVILLSEDTV